MTFDAFLQALTAHYGTVGTAPGIMSSYINDRRLGRMMYYVAVQSFPDGTVQSRTIVARAIGESLSEALYKLHVIWKQKLTEGVPAEPLNSPTYPAAGVNMKADVAKLAELGYPDPGVEAIDKACGIV